MTNKPTSTVKEGRAAYSNGCASCANPYYDEDGNVPERNRVKHARWARGWRAEEQALCGRAKEERRIRNEG